MVAGRVTESYLGLFLKSRHDDGSRATAIAKFGALEVRLVEMQTVNVCESLWVELYDRDRQIGVDSCKCTDLDEAIDATQLLIAQARQLNSEAEDPVCAAIEPLPSDLQGFRCGSDETLRHADRRTGPHSGHDREVLQGTPSGRREIHALFRRGHQGVYRDQRHG